MKQFKVWDQLNSEESEAKTIMALDARDAAIMYAEADGDGWIDGLYHESEQPICVIDSSGEMFVFEVYAEITPVFKAHEAKR